MNDLIERLRAEDTNADDCFAAADAIERLTQERDEAHQLADTYAKIIREGPTARAKRAEAERDAARAEVERLQMLIEKLRASTGPKLCRVCGNQPVWHGSEMCGPCLSLS